MKNHQPRLRVVACVQQNCLMIRQASLPAYGLEHIIRMEGAATALHMTGIRLELAPKVNITLIEVNQNAKGHVKYAQKRSRRRFTGDERGFIT
jgi:hypothetical protein